MAYNVDDIDRILGFSTWTNRQKVDELLRIDASLYANMGTDTLRSDRKETRRLSKKLYRAIKIIDPEQGELYLRAMINETD